MHRGTVGELSLASLGFQAPAADNGRFPEKMIYFTLPIWQSLDGLQPRCQAEMDPSGHLLKELQRGRGAAPVAVS